MRGALAEVELRLASQDAAHAAGDRAVRRPHVPEPPGAGPPPAALVSYLDAAAEREAARAAAAAAGGGVRGGAAALAAGMRWEDLALLHAMSAASAAGHGAAGARARAAALAAAGEALCLKARAAAGGGAAAPGADAGGWRAPATEHGSPEAPDGAGGTQPGAAAGCGAGGSAEQGPAAFYTHQAAATLRSAVEEALAAGEMRAARRAALALSRCCASASEAAEWLAAAQSAGASVWLRELFVAAAGGAWQPEVLAWRRLEACERGAGLLDPVDACGAAGFVAQVSRRAQVPFLRLSRLCPASVDAHLVAPGLLTAALRPLCAGRRGRGRRRRRHARSPAGRAAAAARPDALGAAGRHARPAAAPRRIIRPADCGRRGKRGRRGVAGGRRFCGRAGGADAARRQGAVGGRV